MQRLVELLEVEVDKRQLDRTIQARVKRQMEKAQKEYYLNEQIKAIHKELGRKDEKAEMEDLRKRIEEAGMTDEAKEKALQELHRLEAMPPMSAEGTVSRTYIDWLLSVPWKQKSKEIRDISKAEEVLNEDHYGLEKIKDRILEHLAVRQLVKSPKGSILCFVGPPGVGKTSSGKSIARATGRKFVRLSLGGVRDEAEMRGHRRTYIGALPGQIIQMMKKAGTVNPCILLDEVDKLGADFRGDPSAALLEVLRPGAEQLLPGSLPRRRVRPLEGLLHRDGERAAHHPAAAARPAGDSAPLGLHRAREAWRSPSATSSASRPRARGCDPSRSSSPTRASSKSSATTRARRACATSNARSARAAARSRASSSPRARAKSSR